MQEVTRLKDSLQTQVNERDSALKMIRQELDVSNTRLENNTRILTNTQTEILELRQKLELSEARTLKYREEVREPFLSNYYYPVVTLNRYLHIFIFCLLYLTLY